MNLLLIEDSELDADKRLVIHGRRAEHLLRILKVEPGDNVRVGVLDGGVGQARVEEILSTDKKSPSLSLTVDIESGDDDFASRGIAEAAMPSHIEVVLALPRPAVLHRVLQHAATLGVDRLDLINAWNVPKSYFQSPSLEPEAIRRHLILGLEQGRRTRLPEVHIHKRLVPFVEGLAEIPGTEKRLFAHLGVEDSIEEIFREENLTNSPSTRRIRLAIGPEGGWIDREIETFGEAGFRKVSLGPWILRSEAALTAAIAQIAVLRRLANQHTSGLC